MASTKSTLYVGGIDDSVTPEIIHAAFIPFGDIVDIQLPRDNTNKTRGFAFVQYEDPEDAKAALDNMNESELYGRVLKVNIAQPQAVNKNRAVWEEADDWYKKLEEEKASSDATATTSS